MALPSDALTLHRAFCLVMEHLEEPCVRGRVQDLLWLIDCAGLELDHNIVVCLLCQRVMESVSARDFQECGCPNNTSVTGGRQPGAWRCNGRNMSLVRRFRNRAEADGWVAEFRRKIQIQ